jgi:hypothetical protein
MKIDEVIEALDYDEATVDLEDGRKLRLRIEPDQSFDINDDSDAYGKVEWGTKDDYGEHRPKGFSGNAEKLGIYDHGTSLWWEPPEDMKRTDAENFRKFKATVRDLAEYGFHGVILELLQGEDAYHRPIVVKVASLWGVDDVGREYLKDVVSELAVELEVDG